MTEIATLGIKFDASAARMAMNEVFAECMEDNVERIRALVQRWLDESPAKGLRFTYQDAEALVHALKAA